MRILVALGPDPDAYADTLAGVTAFPWPAGSVFSVLTVAEAVSPPPMVELIPGARNASDVQSRADVAAEMAATSAAAQLRDHGFAADGIGKEGDPKSIIVDHAKEWGAGLVVVGACEKSRIEKFLLGSVSESVVKHAPCSVLVLRPGTRNNP